MMGTTSTANEQFCHSIIRLKSELNAIIMAHNYQRPEVQDIADITGDSLELARQATGMDASVLVVCGVRFMAESAAILNPSRTVLLSEDTAGCPMADMLNIDDLKNWRKRYPGATVVCYINSSAEVKAESDYCCTSANALQVVDAIPNDEILFIPDQNLGYHISTMTRKRIILYPGYCPVHHRLSSKHVIKAKQEHPDSVVLVHPECRAEVVEQADAVLSTSQMSRYAATSTAKTFLIGTEAGLVYRLQKDHPDKKFFVISPSLICPDMKKTTLESILMTMKLNRNVVTVPEEISSRAKLSLDRMLSVV